MSDAEQERRFRGSCYLAGIVGVLLVAASGFWGTRWPRYVDEPVRDIAIALFISAGLALSLEKYLRENFVRQASRDVVQYLLGYGFPKAGQEKIKSILFENPIILENFVAEYTLLPWENPDAPELVKIRYTKTYDIVNITNHEVPYNHGISTDAHDQPEDFQLECDSSEQNGKYNLTRDEIAERVAASRARNTGEIEVRYSIPIKPNNRARRAIWYKVQSSVVLTVPKNYGTGVTFGSPVIGVTVRANCPGLRFTTYGADIRTTNQWEYRRFFVGGEFIPIRWVREENPARPSSEAASGRQDASV